MTDVELIEKMRNALRSLTPGKWASESCGSDGCWCKCIGNDHPEHNKRGVVPSGCMDKHDADAIVFIRNHLDELIDMAEKSLKGKETYDSVYFS